jgi:DNA helicase-2/ATP-dependent DNA helicase PcrA
MFTLVAWFPFLQNNPEGQVYLEALARGIATAGQISPYESLILQAGDSRDQQSVAQIIRGFFEAVAEGSVEVDEEIMPYVPRNYFSVMTIHQAKGLEFPLLVVDVGSQFQRDHHTQRRHRYPTTGDTVHLTEMHLANFTPVGPARSSRGDVQRAFDDLRRLYYVAKSRSQSVLVLAGSTALLTRRPREDRYQVPAVAMGDLYDTSGAPSTGARAYTVVPAADWSDSSPPNHIVRI